MTSTKKHILFHIVAFTAMALLLGVYGYVGRIYEIVTAALGLYWLSIALAGFKAGDERAWARKMFIFSVLCITALSVMMALDYATPSGSMVISSRVPSLFSFRLSSGGAAARSREMPGEPSFSAKSGFEGYPG